MKFYFNFLAWVIVGGTLGLNNIHWNSLSFWVIMIAMIVIEHTVEI